MYIEQLGTSCNFSFSLSSYFRLGSNLMGGGGAQGFEKLFNGGGGVGWEQNIKEKSQK